MQLYGNPGQTSKSTRMKFSVKENLTSLCKLDDTHPKRASLIVWLTDGHMQCLAESTTWNRKDTKCVGYSFCLPFRFIDQDDPLG
jgi:hypothetical protein